MNKKLDGFKNEIKGKKVTVLGIGISNIPLIKYLISLGAEVNARDKRTREEMGEVFGELQTLGVTLNLGENYLENLTGEIIFKTPGMRYDLPELQTARRTGSVVTSEMEVFFELCPSHIIGITGSDGKTTTTTIIYKALTEAGYKTWLGGNIGKPLLSDVEEMTADDWVVVELSSFQLHTMKKSPEIAVLTNISPNHLDVHKSYEEYIEAKKNILLHQNSQDIVVANLDNRQAEMAASDGNGIKRYFSRESIADVYLDNGIIKRGNVPVLNVDDIKIPGMHNVENYMAAITALYGIVDDEVIRNVAKNFGGVEHRIEYVRTLDGVKYYNSSIDSSPNRTINTLRVFDKKVIMIAGGKDKGIPYDEIGTILTERVKVLILIGATADKIEKALRDEIKRTGKGIFIEVIRVSTYEEAVNTAHAKAESGDTVILSPASTSFDMFKNFEERGNLFKKLVNELE